MVDERRAQEAGLEDRNARAEPAPGADLDGVPDVGVRVDVDELDGPGQAVVAGGAEVDRPGIEKTDTQQPAVGEELVVGVALGEAVPEADGRVEQRGGVRVEDGPPS